MMATTAFNAFWDGPDKFSFGAPQHHTHSAVPDQAGAEHVGCEEVNYFSFNDTDTSLDCVEESNLGFNGHGDTEIPTDQQENLFSAIRYSVFPQYDAQHPKDTAFCSSFHPKESPFAPLMAPSSCIQPSATSDLPQNHYMFIPQHLLPYENSMHFPGTGSPVMPPLQTSNSFHFEEVTTTTAQMPLFSKSITYPIQPTPFSVEEVTTDSVFPLLHAPLVPSTSPIILPLMPVARRRRMRNAFGRATSRHDDTFGGSTSDQQRSTVEEQCDVRDSACILPNCTVCCRDLPECLRTSQPSWAAILRVVFYTLRLNYPQKEFFNLRSHVYDFVDTHWSKICVGKVKSEHWKKQLQDTLAHNKKLFVSGADVFKQKGFWRLECSTDPWEEKISITTTVHHSHLPKSLVVQCFDEDDNTPKQRKQRSQKRPKIAQ